MYQVEHVARGMTVAIGAALGFDGTLGLVAQSIPEFNDVFLMQLAEKGGGWAVLLIVLFFYRRDYQKLTTSDNEVRKELLTAARERSESDQQVALALFANTEVLRSIKAEKHGQHYEERR